MSFRTILHATDFSLHADAAFDVACRLARDAGARLVVLHVAQPPVVIYDECGNLLAQPGDYRDVARERLDRAQAPGLEVQHRLEAGEVASAILRVASEIAADLIVMGTQGRAGLDRLVIGSAAGTVLRQARCPVVVVRALGPE
jgi:nucleotide-binding universal stress UspA family protein